MNEWTRRQFMQTFAAAGLALGCSIQGKRQWREIGLQVFTIRKSLQADWEKTLRRVAEIGYNTLEMGSYYGESPEAFKAFLHEIGLKVISGGGSIGALRSNLSQLIDQSLAMEKEYLVCFWPWEGSTEGKTIDDWRRLAEELNTIGETVKRSGLRFAYHNHDIEFRPTDDKIPFDVLLQETDPTLVGIELDIYWMVKGNRQPIDYLESYPGRFPLWHVKDMDATPQRGFACVGEGVIDFPAIFKRAERAGLRHIFVENDEPKDELACIKSSCEYLRAMRY
ncbi:MAG: sugar phosphate isomerase/epimerase [candidate division KSB1 bacterium]|nr:sugar phosphate isomerase/epimerase [candidate division KSB1 bacterium]